MTKFWSNKICLSNYAQKAFDVLVNRTSHLIEKYTGRIKSKFIEPSWEAMLVSIKDQGIKCKLKLFFSLAWPFQRMVDRWMDRAFEQPPGRCLMCLKSDLGTHSENMSCDILCVNQLSVYLLCSRPKDLGQEQILIKCFGEREHSPKAACQIDLTFIWGQISDECD